MVLWCLLLLSPHNSICTMELFLCLSCEGQAKESSSSGDTDSSGALPEESP